MSKLEAVKATLNVCPKQPLRGLCGQDHEQFFQHVCPSFLLCLVVHVQSHLNAPYQWRIHEGKSRGFFLRFSCIKRRLAQIKPGDKWVFVWWRPHICNPGPGGPNFNILVGQKLDRPFPDKNVHLLPSLYTICSPFFGSWTKSAESCFPVKKTSLPLCSHT